MSSANTSRRKSKLHWRRLSATPLRWFLRRRLSEHCAVEPTGLRSLEAGLRSGDMEQVISLLPGLERLQRIVFAIDPAEYRRALAQAHRAVIRQASEAVPRTYAFSGFAVTHDIRNLAEWHVFVEGQYQPGIRELLLRFSHESSGVADIGANVGIFTLPLARHVTKGQVYAFEPNPASYKVLAEAVIANGLEKRVTVEPVALGSAEGDVEFVVPAGNAGAAGIVAAGQSRSGHAFRVRVRTFDAWWSAAGEPSISVIKIDVEGHEPEVLRGMRKALDALRPVLILEVSPDVFDPAALFARLRAADYELFRVEDRPPFYSTITRRDLRKQFNLLAVPRDRLNELLQPWI